MELQTLIPIKSQAELSKLYSEQKKPEKIEEIKYQAWYNEMKVMIIQRLRNLPNLLSKSQQAQIKVLDINDTDKTDDFWCIMENYMSASDRFYETWPKSRGGRYQGKFLHVNVIPIAERYKMIQSIREYIIRQYELDFDLIVITEPAKWSIQVYADISKKIS